MSDVLIMSTASVAVFGKGKIFECLTFNLKFGLVG